MSCVYTCVCRCTRTNGHTPLDLGLFSHGLGLLFQCGPGLDPQGSSEQGAPEALWGLGQEARPRKAPTPAALILPILFP